MVEKSTSDLLLIAASSLAKKESAFSIPDLIVTAWEMFPEDFGVPGDEHGHPDSSRVFDLIIGDNGLKASGLIARGDGKLYTLTDAAKKRIEDMAKAEIVVLSKQQIEYVLRLLSSPAVVKCATYKTILRTEMEYFLGIEGECADVNKAIAEHERRLTEIELYFDANEEAIVDERTKDIAKPEEVNPRKLKPWQCRITGATIRMLKNTGDLCASRHERWLNVLRGKANDDAEAENTFEALVISKE